MPIAATASRIRRADLTDLDALVALEAASFAHDRLSRAQYRRHLDSNSAQVMVATEPQALLGASVVLYRRGTRVARLYSLATALRARGRGIGADLLAAIEEPARRHGCDRIRLEVRADNGPAITLYQRAGYAEIGIRPAYYEDGADARRLEKALN